MSQYSRVPEYIVEESGKTSPTVNQPDYTNREYSQVVVDLVALSRQVVLLQGMLGNIESQLRDLVASLQEQE